MKNDRQFGTLKNKRKINKIKGQLARLRAKLKASENKHPLLSSSKPKPKKIKSEAKQAKKSKKSK